MITPRSRPFGSALGLVSALALALAACAPSTPAASPSAPSAAATSAASAAATQAAPVELTFFYPIAVPGPITKLIDGYIDRFQKANPGVTVKPVLSGGYPDTLTKIQTTIKGGGTPPDVAVLLSTDLYSLVDSGAVLPLDDQVKAAGGDSYLADIYPAFLANSRYQGHIWGLPFQRSTPVLFYNKDLFKAAGIDAASGPKSYQTLVDNAKALTKPGTWGIEISSDGIPYWLFQPFAIGNGTNVFSAANKATFDSPKVIEGLQDFVDLTASHKVMPNGILQWANMPNDFVNGKAAMIWHSSGSLATILAQAKFPVGVSYTVGRAGYGAPTGGGNMYMLKGIPADHQAAAWKFIQFMSSAEIQADWSINTGYIAARKSAYQTSAMKEYLAKTPQAQVIADGLQYAGAELATHDNAKVQKALGDAVQAALTGKATPEAALKTAQQQADQILSSYKD